MKRSLLLAAAISAALTLPAAADWQLKDALGAQLTFGTVDVGSVKHPKYVAVDGTGTPYSSSNPMTVQGNVGIAGLLPGFAVPPAVTVAGSATAAKQDAAQTTLNAMLAALQAQAGGASGGSGGTVVQGAAGTAPWLVSQQGPLPAGTNTLGGVNVVSLPALPAGSALIGTVNLGTIGTAATAAKQDAAQATLNSMLTTLQAQGSGGSGSGGTVMQGAAGVNPWLVSQQGALPAGANTIGTVNLGTIGTAATASAQATGNASLASIDAKTPALASLPTLTGQTAGNSSLAAIATNTAGLATATGQTAATTAITAAIASSSVQTGTAGTPATAVLSIQGVANGQPIITASGTTINNTFVLPAAAATTNATLFSATPKKLYGIQLCSAASAIRYLKIFDKVSAPVPGTDTAKKSIPIPAGGCLDKDYNAGYTLANGLGIAITAGSSLTDATAVAAGDIVGLNIDTN